MMRRLALLTASLFVLGCATTTPVHSADLFQQLQASVLMTDLTQAAQNLTNAIANGDLPANDPAAACLQGVVRSTAPSPQAQPYELKGLVSLGSLLYIDAHRVGRAKVAADQSCQALIGSLVIQGLNQVTPVKLPGQ
jgi:hypothetical protein